MVTTQKIANKINAELNSIAAEMNIAHEFKLMAHLGKGKDDNKIYGVLKVAGTKVKNTGGTTAGVISTNVTYVAEFITPTAQDNYYATTIEQVIGALVDTKSGGHFTDNGETVVWTIERGVPKDYALRDNVGSSIPIAFTINATISANGLLNGVKEWRLDGQLIPYSKEVIVLNKDGVTISIAEFSRQKSVMLAQMQEFRFTIPYDKTNTVCTTLQNDILNGDFRKTYTLSYSDGVVSFSRVVSLYRSGDMGTQDGDSTDINVSFVEAGASSYTEGADTVTYKLGLFTFPFGKNSDNTLYFDSQANQQTYMNTQVANASGEQVIKAPNLNNTLTVSTSFDAGLSSAGVYEIVNYNYAVLKREVTNAETMYLYYWVNNATIGADGMVMLELEQDTVQTIMFNPDLEIPDCMIERAHLNRWVDNGDGTVSFDGTPTSKLFEREPIQNFSKRLKLSKDFALVPNNYDGFDPFITQPVSEFFDNYVQAWAYVYLDANVDLGQHSTKTDPCLVELRASNDDDGSLMMPYIVLCYPIMMNGGVINVSTQQGVQSGQPPVSLQWDFKNFVGTSISASILNIKFSQESPFPKFNAFDQFSFAVTSTGVLTITNAKTADWENGYWGAFNILASIGANSSSIMTYIVYKHQLNSAIGGNLSYGVNWRSFDLEDDFYIQTKFYKYDIIGQNRNIEFNPKLLTSDYTELKLGQGLGEPYSYEILKFCKTNPTLSCVWSEGLTPATNKTYLALYERTTTGGIYNETTASHYVGASITQDLTFPYTVSQLQQFLAQNKNFFLQSVLGTAQGVVNGPIGGAIAGAAAGKSPQNVAGAMVGATVGTGVSIISQALSMDNMKNSPLSYKGLSGDPALGLSLNGGRSYVQIWQALPNELEMANNFMYINGFTYGQLDNIANHIHTRKYFNYIKAEIEDIQGVSVSNMIRENFKQRFSNGIRFWNYATFATNGVQYEKENYELWLED